MCGARSAPHFFIADLNQCPFRVKTGKPQCEQMFSAVIPTTDIRRVDGDGGSLTPSNQHKSATATCPLHGLRAAAGKLPRQVILGPPDGVMVQGLVRPASLGSVTHSCITAHT